MAVHGGNVDEIARKYKYDPMEIIDFSANIGIFFQNIFSPAEKAGQREDPHCPAFFYVTVPP